MVVHSWLTQFNKVDRRFLHESNLKSCNYQGNYVGPFNLSYLARHFFAILYDWIRVNDKLKQNVQVPGDGGWRLKGLKRHKRAYSNEYWATKCVWKLKRTAQTLSYIDQSRFILSMCSPTNSNPVSYPSKVCMPTNYIVD